MYRNGPRDHNVLDHRGSFLDPLSRLQPMLATVTNAPFDDADWVVQDKYDGFRLVACVENGRVTLYSRSGKIISR